MIDEEALGKATSRTSLQGSLGVQRKALWFCIAEGTRRRHLLFLMRTNFFSFLLADVSSSFLGFVSSSSSFLLFGCLQREKAFVWRTADFHLYVAVPSWIGT